MDPLGKESNTNNQSEETLSEDILQSTTSESSVSGTSDYEANDEYNRHLQMRILCLRDTIHALKTQLHDEREIWKREIEERRENDYINRAAEMGYQYFNDPKLLTTPVSVSVADLENDLTKYSENLIQSHYEQRQNLQKQISMSNYKRRLLEVENMCNLELLRVKQSVQILQPLQMMCSEWKFSDEAGDINKERNNANKIDVTDEEKLKNNCRPTEITMPLELIAQKADMSNSAIPETNSLAVSRSQPNLNEYCVEENNGSIA